MGVPDDGKSRNTSVHEEFKDIKGVIRIRKSKKDRQHSAQKDKQRSTKHTHKSKYRVTRTPLKTGGEPNSKQLQSQMFFFKSLIVRKPKGINRNTLVNVWEEN
jgi:hypothetical protein